MIFPLGGATFVPLPVRFYNTKNPLTLMNGRKKQILLEKTPTLFKNSVVIGHWRRKSKNHLSKTAKLKNDRQRKGIDKTT
jgi:hypothetical protein